MITGAVGKRSLTIDSPLGLFAPGFKQVADYFGNMWKEASSDRERWGCKSIPELPP